MLVAIATLPFKFRKFHEQDYSGVKDFMKKKKKKKELAKVWESSRICSIWGRKTRHTQES